MFLRVPAEVYGSCNLVIDSPSLPLVMRVEDTSKVEEMFSQSIDESAKLDYRKLMTEVTLLLTDVWSNCKQKMLRL